MMPQKMLGTHLCLKFRIRIVTSQRPRGSLGHSITVDPNQKLEWRAGEGRPSLPSRHRSPGFCEALVAYLTQDVRGHLSQGGKAWQSDSFDGQHRLYLGCFYFLQVESFRMVFDKANHHALLSAFDIKSWYLLHAVQETLQPKGYGFCDFADCSSSCFVL